MTHTSTNVAVSEMPRDFREDVKREFHDGLDLFLAKNADYKDSFERCIELYATNGIDPMLAILPRIADKYGRIVNLALNGERKVEDEAVLDTLRDLGTYCFMAAAILR